MILGPAAGKLVCEAAFLSSLRPSVCWSLRYRFRTSCCVSVEPPWAKLAGCDVGRGRTQHSDPILSLPLGRNVDPRSRPSRAEASRRSDRAVPLCVPPARRARRSAHRRPSTGRTSGRDLAAEGDRDCTRRRSRSRRGVSSSATAPTNPAKRTRTETSHFRRRGQCASGPFHARRPGPSAARLWCGSAVLPLSVHARRRFNGRRDRWVPPVKRA